MIIATSRMRKVLAQYLYEIGLASCVYAIIYDYDRGLARQKEEVA